MKLYYAGAEVKGWRELLARENVHSVALSYVGLQRRLKSADSWGMESNFAPGTSVFVDSGAYTLNREGSDYTEDTARELCERYVAFVKANSAGASLVSEFDAQILGQDYIEELRKDYFNSLPANSFMPVWHSTYGQDNLEYLANSYEVVGIRHSDMTEELIPVLNSFAGRYGVRFHGSGITGREIMRKVKWDSVSSSSWLSPSVFGDTIIWSDKDKTLHRYPKAYKRARRQYRTLFQDNDFDSAKIEADDPTELLRLSLWSWGKFVNYLNGVTNTTRNEQTGSMETGTSSVDTQEPEHGNLPAIRETRETTLIPVMGLSSRTTKVTGDDGEEAESTEIFTETRSESMRACNTCFLREKCPGFKPGANCLYNIPIEVKTTDQLKALQAALVEMQAQRVLFMKMAEDLEGGYADPNLSSEMDRLQRMLKSKAEAEKEGFSLKIEASGSDGAPGYLSRMFGSGAAEKALTLEAPIKVDSYIQEHDIVDAEVVN